MNKIDVLDCTLRDGGYINQWQFGEKNIKKIISCLIDSNVDIIECGFLSDKAKGTSSAELLGSTLFDSLKTLQSYLPNYRNNSMLVCMINYDEYDVTSLPQYDGTSIEGIRLAFHKRDLDEALKLCPIIIDKGYKLFLQPMVTLTYSDTEFINLIIKANAINPYAFYIVDSFGVMSQKDLLRLYYLVDHNLSSEVYVGYHSHNNIQMAYSNAQMLVDLKTKRHIIIDASVLGMGRGAGNLNTELFIEYIKDLNGSNYKIKPLLKIIDQVLRSIYAEKFWGYSLPYYASALNNCHPNYATYLDDKSTLTIEHITDILSGIEDSKKTNFDKEYIEMLYLYYQKKAIRDDEAKNFLTSELKGKKVIIIASGSSINEDADKIASVLANGDCVTIAINFKPEHIECDFIFVSNLRRYEDLKVLSDLRLIKTSNVDRENLEGIVVNYSDLINEITAVEDNAGMMLLKLLISIGVKSVMMAGFDGYSHEQFNNYAHRDLNLMKNTVIMDEINQGMTTMLNRFVDEIDIEFITEPRYIKLDSKI